MWTVQGVKWLIIILFAQLMYFADLRPGGVQLSYVCSVIVIAFP